MQYETAGDPMSSLKWTKKTTQKIADELASIEIIVGFDVRGANNGLISAATKKTSFICQRKPIPVHPYLKQFPDNSAAID